VGAPGGGPGGGHRRLSAAAPSSACRVAGRIRAHNSCDRLGRWWAGGQEGRDQGATVKAGGGRGRARMLRRRWLDVCRQGLAPRHASPRPGRRAWAGARSPHGRRVLDGLPNGRPQLPAIVSHLADQAERAFLVAGHASGGIADRVPVREGGAGEGVDAGGVGPACDAGWMDGREG